MRSFRGVAALAIMVAVMTNGDGLAARNANYDESQVPAYELPDVLTCADGSRVKDAETWRTKRRPEVRRLFEEHVYGRMPGKPDRLDFKVLESNDRALDGHARAVGVAVQARCVARLRLVGDRVNDRGLGDRRRPGDAGLVGEHQERDVDRVAVPLPLVVAA